MIEYDLKKNNNKKNEKLMASTTPSPTLVKL